LRIVLFGKEVDEGGNNELGVLVYGAQGVDGVSTHYKIRVGEGPEEGRDRRLSGWSHEEEKIYCAGGTFRVQTGFLLEVVYPPIVNALSED
jgi:hypothetical protein